MVATAIVAGVVIPVAHRCVDERPSERFIFVQVSLELRALASVKPDRRRRLIFQRRVALCGFRFAGVVLLRCSYSCAYIFASIAFRCVEGVTCLNSLRRHFIVFIFLCGIIVRRSVVRSSSPQRQGVSRRRWSACVASIVFSSSVLIRCVVISYRSPFLVVSRRACIASCQLLALECVLRFLHRLVRRYYVVSCIVNLVCVALTCLVCSLRLSRT